MRKRRSHEWFIRAILGVALFGVIACRDGQPAHETAEIGDSVFNQSELSIAITGRDFQWEIVYPGRDGQLGTADDLRSKRDLDVPARTTITLLLTSQDYIYMFELPEIGVREMAVPELEFSVTFGPVQPNVYDLRGNQMCGYEHPDLLGRLFVHTPSQFSARMRLLEANRPSGS